MVKLRRIYPVWYFLSLVSISFFSFLFPLTLIASLTNGVLSACQADFILTFGLVIHGISIWILLTCFADHTSFHIY